MKNQWWGYLHTEGTVSVKRYFDYQDIEEAKRSPFVKWIYGPFYADNREEALLELNRYFGVGISQ